MVMTWLNKLLVLSMLVFQFRASDIIGVVNTPVTLPCLIACSADAEWTIFHPSQANIAHCGKDTCRVNKSFQKRFTFSGDITRGNFSLLIRSIAYNDLGLYRCSCDGKKSEVKLKVFVPTVVTVSELKNVTLPCYGDTRRDANDVQWTKDGQKVLLYDRKKGSMTTGDGFEKRVFLSQEAFADGDLSLNISSVQQSDAGLYLCSIHHESREGEPRAVLLEVKEANGSWLTGIIVLVVGLSVVVIILFIIWSCKKFSWWEPITFYIRGQQIPNNPVQEEHQSHSSENEKILHTEPF